MLSLLHVCPRRSWSSRSMKHPILAGVVTDSTRSMDINHCGCNINHSGVIQSYLPYIYIYIYKIPSSQNIFFPIFTICQLYLSYYISSSQYSTRNSIGVGYPTQMKRRQTSYNMKLTFPMRTQRKYAQHAQWVLEGFWIPTC